jgi:beta-alanine degradation protein BauB
MPTARSETSADDDRVRITTWTFEDGEDTGHHRHEYDYIVVPITGGTFARSSSGGELGVYVIVMPPSTASV